jgi:chromosome segregation ATPase
MITLRSTFHPALVLALLIFILPGALRAQDAAQETTESRLRDALRNTMLQLRDAQGQIATLQAAQAQSDQDTTGLKAKIDTLNTQIASITKQAADDKAVSDKAIGDLKTQNADQATQIGKLNDALAAWEKDDKQYLQLSKDKEAARAQLAAQVILMQRVIDDRETKNLALYTLGNEILTRYQKYGLGEAITAKEPFTGLTRVKLQELVQDYQDKLLDQRIIPGQIPAAPQPPKTAATPSEKNGPPTQTASAATP